MKIILTRTFSIPFATNKYNDNVLKCIHSSKSPSFTAVPLQPLVISCILFFEWFCYCCCFRCRYILASLVLVVHMFTSRNLNGVCWRCCYLFICILDSLSSILAFLCQYTLGTWWGKGRRTTTCVRTCLGCDLRFFEFRNIFSSLPASIYSWYIYLFPISDYRKHNLNVCQFL